MLLEPFDRRVAPPDAVQSGGRPTVCVGIATRGRPDILAQTVLQLDRQSLPPAEIVICGSTPDDVGTLADRAGITVLFASAGLPRQRNAILDHLATRPSVSYTVVFLDDDFALHDDWLRSVVEAFDAHPNAGVITGHVVADGIQGPGLSFSEASAAVANSQPIDYVRDTDSPYGCNMAFRGSAIGHNRFDERLVLYGWLEDRDFGSVMRRAGWQLLQIGSARGAHMGAKRGRVAGTRLGYSQVMNPAYLARKGTMTPSDAALHAFRNCAANLVRALAPEPYVDRRGRLKGNALAFLDLCRGRFTPERAEQI